MPAAIQMSLSAEALKELHSRLKAREVVPSVRTRLLALLYFHQGYNAEQIARLGLVTALTAGRIRRAYRNGGFAALEDRVRLGRPGAFTPEMRVRVLKLVRQDNRTWNCTTLLEVLHEEFGLSIDIDTETLRLQLRAIGLSWQRTRLVAPPAPDPAETHAMQRDLEALKKGRSPNS